MIKPYIKYVPLEMISSIAQETAGVYVLHDSTGAPMYIGQTKQLKTRLSEHLSKYSQFSYRIKDYHLLTFYIMENENNRKKLEGILISRLKPKYNDRKHVEKQYRV